MRKLTIKREKTFIGCAGVMKVYIEDPTSDELTMPVYTKDEATGEEKTERIRCRKLGELKNGEEKSFEIGREALRVFVIADKLSRDYCSDCYQVPAGEGDLSISGQNRFDPLAGNPFRFAGSEGTVNTKKRKISLGKGALMLVCAVLIGFFIGYGIMSLIIGGINSKDKTFYLGDMTIVLNGGFEQQSAGSHYAALTSKEVDVIFDTVAYSGSTAPYTPAEYARTVLLLEGRFDDEIIEKKNYAYCIYTEEGKDGNEYRYFLYTYISDNNYWSVYFIVDENDAKGQMDNIFEWADSVSFK